MADLKHRTPPPNPLPADESFTPGRDPGPDAHPPEDAFFQNIMFESNDYKLEHYRATAQLLANTYKMAMLLHFYALPHFQRTNPTMMAAFIPADEGTLMATASPAPPTKRAEQHEPNAHSTRHRR
jgi:hypothetical protein